MFVDAAAAVAGDTTTDIVYLTGTAGATAFTTVGSGSSAYLTAPGFLNGEKSDAIKFDTGYDYTGTIGSLPAANKTFYDATIDDDGNITAIAATSLAINGTASDAIVKAADASTFLTYTTDSKTKIYIIDGDEDTDSVSDLMFGDDDDSNN